MADISTVAELESVLFDYLPKNAILERYSRARGKELERKFANPESSSALVANAFGFFMQKPGLITLPYDIVFPNQAQSVHIEQELRFPWRGGLHPWLDVVIETQTQLIGIESKRYEPYRERKNLFSEAYRRPVWGNNMHAFERLRDELNEGYLHLDPVQLTKHAFAIREQSRKRNKKGILMYLYAEPATFPDGKPVFPEYLLRHRNELNRFAAKVQGDEVQFRSAPYQEVLELWNTSGDKQLVCHAAALARHYLL